jgi:hypothetical protein
MFKPQANFTGFEQPVHNRCLWASTTIETHSLVFVVIRATKTALNPDFVALYMVV